MASTAIAEMQTCWHELEADVYDVRCEGPVMETPGSWDLWVRHEPDKGRLKNNNIPKLKLQQ